MTTIVLNHSREDAKVIIKASMEKSDSIDKYTDEGQRILGQQEASLTGGNGARLMVDISEAQKQTNQVEIEVTAEKEVSVDIATSPEDIKSEFLSLINELREREIAELVEEMNQAVESKEVSNSAEFSDAQSTLAKRFLIVFTSIMGFSIVAGILMMIVITIIVFLFFGLVFI
ncbi:hypothetical protein [Haloarcula sp. CGMCC 1.6347]|uniref:hypothetical protein n=1 Tax=Haloarcula sp. CGMCC 1.6347 TaxID=3111455 RepID=UPI00300F7AA1